MFELSRLADQLGLEVHEERRWLLEILEILPNDQRGQSALCDSYRRAQEWEALSFALLDFAEREEALEEAKLDHLYEAAEITEEVLAEPEQAIALWSQIRELDEANERALGALERLYLSGERFDELASFYLDLLEEETQSEGGSLRDKTGSIITRTTRKSRRSNRTLDAEYRILTGL